MALPNQQAVDYPSFKLVLVGDEGTGKSSFIKRHLTGEFETKYEPKTKTTTVGVEIHPLDFFTNRGKIRFYCWDINPLQNGYCILSDCAIMMFDATTRQTYTYRNVARCYRDLCSTSGNIHVVLCGNKFDMKKKEIPPDHVRFERGNNLPYYMISTKSNYNLEKPFLYLARELLGDPTLEFVESTALAPPEMQIDLVAQEKREAELANAANLPLPDDEDYMFIEI